MTNAPFAEVQSVFDPAIREINALECRIATTEDDADRMLWQQAAQVVAQLDAGLSQRQLAAQWTNGRTGEPYSVAHVNHVAKVYRVKSTEHPRPRFRDVYNGLANTSKRLTHNTGCFESYTPAEVIDAARGVLGAIDLDPASWATANEVVRAARFFTAADDGLAQPWYGRVWMNPPFAAPLIQQFADKLASSVTAGSVTAAITIVNNATETAWFDTLAEVAAAMCLTRGRVRFWQPAVSHTAGPLQGQAILYMGEAVDAFCAAFAGFGPVWLRPGEGGTPVPDTTGHVIGRGRDKGTRHPRPRGCCPLSPAPVRKRNERGTCPLRASSMRELNGRRTPSRVRGRQALERRLRALLVAVHRDAAGGATTAKDRQWTRRRWGRSK